MTRTLEIVICTYNRAADLDRCLARLGDQRDAEADWSVTVVNNNCTDRTSQVVAEHVASGRVPHLAQIFERVQGLTPARRRGVLESTAEWVAFVDDDCLVAPIERRRPHANGHLTRTRTGSGPLHLTHVVNRCTPGRQNV